VKGEIEASAEPGDVAGVGWYFRLIEYNFHKTPLASNMTWGLASNELAPADFTMIHHDPMDLPLGIFNPGLSFFLKGSIAAHGFFRPLGPLMLSCVSSTWL
jgi:hypothetical protein